MFWIIIFLQILVLGFARASTTKILTWKEDGGTYWEETNPETSYEMTYIGQKLPVPCCDHISFGGRNNSDRYEACVQVVEYDVECGRGVFLHFSDGLGYNKYNPDGGHRIYDCNNVKEDIPKYCSPPNELLHVTIVSPVISNTRIVFNITSGLKFVPKEGLTETHSADTSRNNHEPMPIRATDENALPIAAIVGGVIGGVVVLVVTVCCIRNYRQGKRRERLEREESESRYMSDIVIRKPEYKDDDQYS